MQEKKHSTTEQDVAAALIAPAMNDDIVIDDAPQTEAVQETKRQAAKQAGRNNPRAGPAGARRASQPFAPQVMRRAMMGWRAGGR